MDFEDIKKLKQQNTSQTLQKKTNIRNIIMNPFSLFALGNNVSDEYYNLGYKKLNTFFRLIFSLGDNLFTIIIRISALITFANLYISKVSLDIIQNNMGYVATQQGLEGKIDINFITQYIFWLEQKGALLNVILLIVLAFFSGSLYYILLPTRKCKTTLAGQVFKFIIVNKNDLSKISFVKSAVRYFCCFIPILIAVIFCKFFLGTLYYKTLLFAITITYFIWFDMAPNTIFDGQNISDKICGTIVLRQFRSIKK